MQLDMVKLRDEVQKRHGFRLVRTSREPCRDTDEPSFTVDAYLPWRDQDSTRWQSKPKAVFIFEHPGLWDVRAYAILHEMTHLAMWHGAKGVWATTEADCTILEAAWADDILGQGAGAELIRTQGPVTSIPYAPGLRAMTYGANYEISDWKRPQRSWWWKHETAKLKRLGVLDESGAPTYKIADWRAQTQRSR